MAETPRSRSTAPRTGPASWRSIAGRHPSGRRGFARAVGLAEPRHLVRAPRAAFRRSRPRILPVWPPVRAPLPGSCPRSPGS